VTVAEASGRGHVFMTNSFCAAIPTGPALDLANAISEISENWLCAGWLHEIEFLLWGWMHRIPGYEFPDYGQPPDDDDRRALVDLHTKAGGWIACKDVLKFVSTSEWLIRFEARGTAQGQPRT
jgi:hypothetical protein